MRINLAYFSQFILAYILILGSAGLSHAEEALITPFSQRV